MTGSKWNHERFYRIYCELELNTQIKPRKRLRRERPEPLAVPDAVGIALQSGLTLKQMAEGLGVGASTLNNG